MYRYFGGIGIYGDWDKVWFGVYGRSDGSTKASTNQEVPFEEFRGSSSSSSSSSKRRETLVHRNYRKLTSV